MTLRITIPLPLATLALLMGICLTFVLPDIPGQPWVLSLLAVTLSVLCVHTKHVIGLICIVACGYFYMAFNINQQLAHALPVDLEGQKITVTGTISSVVEESKNQKAKFLLKISEVDNNVVWKLPAMVQLSWNKTKKNVQYGDTWRLHIKLKRPRNYANPGSFDSEKYFFQQRIVGLGYVIDTAENHLLIKNVLANPMNHVRQKLLTIIQESLAQCEFKDVILSLVLGIKGGISDDQMEILQNTGTAHLLAVSGLHIGMVAGICFLLLRFLWRFVPNYFLFIPAPWLAACGALLASSAYAILAGLSIATQRSLIMVMVFLGGVLFKRKISATHSFFLALLLILLWDPFAVLSIGFWFSFLAVGFFNLCYAWSC